MNILNSIKLRLSGKLACSEKNRKVLDTLSHKTICRDGKIYSRTGEKIGWYNEQFGIGWLNRKAYNNL